MSEPAIWSTQYDHPTSWDQDFPPLSLPDMLAASAARTPNAPLADFLGRRYSYAQVFAAAERVACGLAKLGIERGDRVGLFLPNVPHYLAAYYGALRLGAIVVNFSPLYTVDELSHQVEDSGTRLLVTLSAAALLPTALKVLGKSSLERLVVGSVAGVLPRGKSLAYRALKRREVAARPNDERVTAFSALIANDGQCAPVEVDPLSDVAVLQYTGGTTGAPKGAMLTHQNLTANARQINAIDPDPQAEDRILGILPFFHVFANTCVLNRTVHRGGMIAMLPRFDAAQALATLQRVKATALPGVPTMYQALLDHGKTASTDFSSLRVCISGGAPLAAELKARFQEVTGAKVVEGYGLTESAGVVSTNPYDLPGRAGTIGQPLPGTRVKLVNKEDCTRAAPEGEPGEIVIKGPQIMRGYWNRPDADDNTFADGWLRTGDVGTIDEAGYVRIVDRLKDMIAVGGFKVFPSQIEAVLYHHPAVREALVIGIPDHYRGEAPKAFVTLEEGATETAEQLRDWLNPQLGKHERVAALVIRESLPKTLVGKLSRKELVAEEKAASG